MIIKEDDYLEHHGVIGMKWGVHRAKRLNAKAAKYKSKAKNLKGNTVYDQMTRDDWNQESKQYSDKANKILKKHERLAGGKKAFDYTKNEKLGKTIAKSILFGSYGASQYNKARANGKSVAKSILSGLAGASGNIITGGVSSIAAPRIKAHRREKNSK